MSDHVAAAVRDDSVPAGERGRTRIATRVVEKVAAHAVVQVDSAAGAPRRLLGVRTGGVAADTPARVRADVSGDVVTVRVAMSVAWPRSVRRVTRDVRAHVVSELERVTGLKVAEVDIRVPAFLTRTEGTGRVT